MHTVCMQATHEPKKWALLNNCAGVEPVENPHFQVWHAHTPHKVEVLRTDWVQVCIAITHFLHVHVMHIALHTNGQVHLWLIGVRLSVCVYETVQPPATYTTTQLPLTTLPAHGGVWFSHNKVPFNTVSLVYQRSFGTGERRVRVVTLHTSAGARGRCFCVSPLCARIQQVCRTA